MNFPSQIFKLCVIICKPEFKASILFYLLFQKALPVKDVKEKPEQQIRRREPEKSASGPDPQQPPSALAARGSRRAIKSPQRSSTKIKEQKHPFALYGWGERQTDTGSQKTHNVCASAPVREVGASERASLLSPGGGVGLAGTGYHTCGCCDVLGHGRSQVGQGKPRTGHLISNRMQDVSYLETGVLLGVNW